jgi:hypothetical protein
MVAHHRLGATPGVEFNASLRPDRVAGQRGSLVGAPCRSRKVTGYVTIARHNAAGRQQSHSKPVVMAYELPPSEKLVMAHPTR